MVLYLDYLTVVATRSNSLIYALVYRLLSFLVLLLSLPLMLLTQVQFTLCCCKSSFALYSVPVLAADFFRALFMYFRCRSC